MGLENIVKRDIRLSGLDRFVSRQSGAQEEEEAHSHFGFLVADNTAQYGGALFLSGAHLTTFLVGPGSQGSHNIFDNNVAVRFRNPKTLPFCAVYLVYLAHIQRQVNGRNDRVKKLLLSRRQLDCTDCACPRDCPADSSNKTGRSKAFVISLQNGAFMLSTVQNVSVKRQPLNSAVSFPQATGGDHVYIEGLMTGYFKNNVYGAVNVS
jgi:hypothetical protein